jgi:hypothetical protein
MSRKNGAFIWFSIGPEKLWRVGLPPAHWSEGCSIVMRRY